MATEESKFIEVQPFSDEMVVSMGPQHPSTHGVLKLELKLDGEIFKGYRKTPSVDPDLYDKKTNCPGFPLSY